MTREEAKAYIIQHCIPNYPKMDKTEWDAAMGKAIEALRQPDPRSFSCGQENDMVSRRAAIDAIMGQPPEPHYPSWYAAQIEKLPAAQPDRDVIDDCLRHIYKNISVHTATGGVIAIRYYMEKLYEEIYGEGERPWWMT